jgi:hypothetical protein
MTRHRTFLARLPVVGILLAVSITSSALAQQVGIHQVEQVVVEKRLKSFKMGNGQRQKELKSIFASAGCTEPNLSEQKVKHSSHPNVICTLSGTEKQVILVGAHFDLAQMGSGVADNWSGSSLLPSLYESLATQTRKHTFVFVGFTDEEKGLIGSKHYAHNLTENERQNLRAVIVLDTLGLSSTKVWHSHSDPQLMNLLVRVADYLKLPVAGVDVDAVGTSDSESFAPLKVPRMTVHSVTQSTLPILHTTQDNLRAIHIEDYYQTYRLLALFLAYLDTSPEMGGAAGPGSAELPLNVESLSPTPRTGSGNKN